MARILRFMDLLTGRSAIALAEGADAGYGADAAATIVDKRLSFTQPILLLSEETAN
jgi:hypothetical protein